MATLLLADESVTIQRVIELTFSDGDVRVIAVGDGESAIARFDEDRPDIVLVDVGMSGVDGYQVAAHVKSASNQIPVLLLTGAFEPIDEDKARATGCDGVLVKPFEPRQLIGTVTELLSGARSADLWPADMPRLEAQPSGATPRVEPVPEPEPALPEPVSSEPIVTPAAAVPEPAPVEAPRSVEPVDETVPALPMIPAIERVALPVSAAVAAIVSETDDLPVPTKVAAFVSDPVDLPVPTKVEARPKVALSNVFSAMLSAERQNPDALKSMAASPALSEAAVEEIVQNVLRKMTNEHVRKIVLETAERLIREEIARIKL